MSVKFWFQNQLYLVSTVVEIVAITKKVLFEFEMMFKPANDINNVSKKANKVTNTWNTVFFSPNAHMTKYILQQLHVLETFFCLNGSSSDRSKSSPKSWLIFSYKICITKGEWMVWPPTKINLLPHPTSFKNICKFVTSIKKPQYFVVKITFAPIWKDQMHDLQVGLNYLGLRT